MRKLTPMFAGLLAALSLAAAVAAQAESEKMPPPPAGHDFMFEKMDANNDGNISREEHEQGLKMMLEKRRAHFAAMDKDGDGMLSREEAQAGREQMREKFREKHPNCPHRPEK